MKRIVVDMSATLLHHGHVRLLEKARQLGGVVIVALTTDEEIVKHKGYAPELTYDQRKELLQALRCVDEVVPSPWLLTEDYLRSINADALVHSGQNSNEQGQIELIEFGRTEGISSSLLRQNAVRAMVQQRNSNRTLFTPGPTNLHWQNIDDILPVFTRNDKTYEHIETTVLENIRRLAGQTDIVAMQGSATTAIEVATSNFLTGNVLIVTSGFYSERILQMMENKSDALEINMKSCSYNELLANENLAANVDWLVAVTTETADAFMSDIKRLKQIAVKNKAKLMIDATGSINLEDDHGLADVCMFSSCKGLGGITGAGFITFNDKQIKRNEKVRELILKVETYIQHKTTATAHAICSLYTISQTFPAYGQRVRDSKAAFLELFANDLYRSGNQPNLCTMVKRADLIGPPLRDHSVLYTPRVAKPGTAVICHLFDQFSIGEPGEIYKHLHNDSTKVNDAFTGTLS